MARDFDDIESGSAGGGWLKPKDYAEAAAMLVAPKSVRVERKLKYKADASRPKSDPDAWGNVVTVTADVYVFNTFTSAESGQPDEILENVNFDGSGLAAAFAILNWQPIPGKTNQEVASAEMKPGAVGAVTRPLRLEKNQDFYGRWEWTRLDPSAKGYDQMVAFRDALPDPDSAPEPVVAAAAPAVPLEAPNPNPWADVPVPF